MRKDHKFPFDMVPSIKLSIVHGVCSFVLALGLGRGFKIDKRWVFLFFTLFFICQPAVFFIWGPYHYYGLYIFTWAAFFILAVGTHRFYIFLQTQEWVIRVFFWLGVTVCTAAILLSTIFEINLRRDPLAFWLYESAHHPSMAAMNHLGKLYQQRRQYDRAMEFYQKALGLNAKSITAWQGLGDVASQMHHWDTSLGFYQKMIDLSPSVPEAYLGKAQDYQRLGKAAEAVETYRHLLDLYPDDETIYVRVIEAYGKAIALNPQETIYQEKREEALGDLEALSKRRSYKATDYFNLAFLYQQVGGKDEAIRFYTRACQLQPDYKQALYNLAQLYQDTGNFKMALAVYSRLLHFDPKFVKAYLNMGEIIHALGDVPKARGFYLKVIALDSQNAQAYFDLGYLSESEGNLQEAINYYEKAIEMDPKNPEGYYNLGNVYARLNQNGEAIALYLKTVTLSPRHQNAFINLSILSFKSRDFAEAIHYLEIARGLGYNAPAEYLKTLEPYRAIENRK